MTDLALTAAAYLAAGIAACVAVCQLMKAITSPEAIQLIAEVTDAVR